MQEPTQPEAPLVVATFLARFLADREASMEAPPATYEALFPGYEHVVRREYERLQEMHAAHVCEPDIAGSHLGKYRILRELGRGGQGVVYLAHDAELDREVALKVLPASLKNRGNVHRRFLREAEAASRLQHPGHCTVYERGTQDGIAYIAMQYVEGESLARRIALERERCVDPRRRSRADCLALARIVEDAARALHVAHEHGLVHRDVKPGNVMVTDEGRAVILDFGLVRRDDAAELGLTNAGDLLGTPYYMAPELLRDAPHLVDRRVDVYALGVTLYEALALEPPHHGPTRERVFQQILDEEPQPLETRVPALSRDLAIVTRCALEKAPERRYQTALDLAEDLRRVRTGEPILAVPPSALRRAMRIVRRHKTASAIVFTCTAFLLALGIWNARHNRELRNQMHVIEEQRRHLEERSHREREALDRSEAARLANRAEVLSLEDVEASLRAARLAFELSPNERTRTQLIEALRAYRARPAWNGASPPAHWVACDGRGTLLAIDATDEILVFDTTTREPAARIPCSAAEHALAEFSPDGTRLLVVRDNHIVRLPEDPLTIALHEARSGHLVATLPQHDGMVRVVAWSKDGKYVLTGDGTRGQALFGPDEEHGKDHAVRVFECATGTLVCTIPGHGDAVIAATFTADERTPADVSIASYGENDEFVVTNLEGRELRRARVDTDVRHGLPNAKASVFANGGKFLVRAQLDDVRLYDAALDTRSSIPLGSKWFLPSQKTTRALAMPGFRSPGASITASGPVYLLDLHRARLTTQFPTYGDIVLAATFRGDYDQEVLMMNADGSLRRFSSYGRELERIAGFGRGLRWATFTHDGKRVAVVTEEGRLHSWTIDEPGLVPVYERVSKQAWCAFDERGERLAVLGDEGFLIHDLVSGRTVMEKSTPGHRPRLATFDGTSSRVAVAFEDGHVEVYGVPEGECVHTLEATNTTPSWLRFTPGGDGMWIDRKHPALWTFADGTLQDVDETWARERRRIEEDANESARAIAQGHGDLTALMTATVIDHLTQSGFVQDVSSDGRIALELPLRRTTSGFVDHAGHEAAVFPIDVPERTMRLETESPIACGSLSTDGSFAVLGTRTGNAHVFETRSGHEIARVDHGEGLAWVALSHDGTLLLTASLDTQRDPSKAHRVRLWNVETRTRLVDLDLRDEEVHSVAMDGTGAWFAIVTGQGRLHAVPTHPERIVEGAHLPPLGDADRASLLK
ncbi:MAG: protein kinase [Planctomycetes bacterium]|nr:protein kinase [Planctomycetota bacterium]